MLRKVFTQLEKKLQKMMKKNSAAQIGYVKYGIFTSENQKRG